jgi:ABC-type transporter Mla subunit MlaD
MMARSRIVPWVSVVLVGLSGVLSVAAWLLQSSAQSDLSRARKIQAAEVPESDAAPPDLDQYQAILDTLDRSIRIRTEIDGRLATLEKLVRSLDSRRKDAEEIATAGREQLDAIGRTLGGAAGAADRSVARLEGLGGRIQTSGRLARLIAEELEELDRSLGPTLAPPDLGIRP